MRQLRPVELGFADTAPVRLSFTADLGVPRGALYRALADEVAEWPRWFTAVTRITPLGGGSARRVELKGGGVFSETIVAAHPGERYTYRVDETNAPGITAMVEDWNLSLAPSGAARARWTVAVDGPLTARTVVRMSRFGLGRAFREAMRNLDRRLRARV
ncbi:SRPBCC family protein [Streptomyces sp. SB3404]|uniref:SRPBCC family protein n=1 Tax=Streptomyces boncukensis TaxID=2711219 RepID=A0A6G4WZK9_9ACTN|nr:SRPBCC family protein [Streptomyces boncukensis]NGO70070.1 SRPBCC family protein [Streptomyces boncukensis]